MARKVTIKKDTLAVIGAVLLLVVGLFAAFSMSESPTGLVVKDCHFGEKGNWKYCSDDCPCDVGEGDCDRNSHCMLGLKCVDNKGEMYGMESWVDVCMGYPSYLKYKQSFKQVTYIINDPRVN